MSCDQALFGKSESVFGSFWLPAYRLGMASSALVCLLLSAQVGLLAYSATKHSPTSMEPAMLASGIFHWEHARFEPYRVNPPLVRVVAAVPSLLSGYRPDWHRFSDAAGSRSEFPLGNDFIEANGSEFMTLLIYARWACIPFSVLGAICAFFWANELYGVRAAFISLTLYVFEPNLLAHGELITPDAACAAFGLISTYTFWRYLKQPSWPRAVLAGLALGCALLTKLSWVLLLFLWPVLWLCWCGSQKIFKAIPQPSGRLVGAPGAGQSSAESTSISQPLKVFAILVVAIYILNAGYLFDGFGTKLGQFEFISQALTGQSIAGISGNRFRTSSLSHVPIPLPKQYVLGFDAQARDFEEYPMRSYLAGEWKHGGWWYYYLYGLAVKTPVANWLLLVLILSHRLLVNRSLIPSRDEFVLLIPAIALLVVVSSQQEFNIHLRYAYPVIGFGIVFLGQVGHIYPPHTRLIGFCTLMVLLIYSVLNTLIVYPHLLTFTNDIAGGPKSCPSHLLGSNFDCGQDWLYVKQWMQSHPEARPFYCLDEVDTSYRGAHLFDDNWDSVIDASQPRPQSNRVPLGAFELTPELFGTELCGYLAVGTNVLKGSPVYLLTPQGRQLNIPCDAFIDSFSRTAKPIAVCGNTITIFQITREDEH